MAPAQAFTETVREIISRHPKSLLAARWDDAQALDPSPVPEAFWIRESKELINIVWLGHAGIADITWFPTSRTATLNYLPFANVADLEVREGPKAAQTMGLSVSGDLVVKVRAGEDFGLIWVATDKRNASGLRRLARAILKLIS